MRTKVFTFCLLSMALSFQFACSQSSSINSGSAETADTNSVVANSESALVKTLDAPTQLNNLRVQALDASQTIQNRDFAKLADYTHPKAFEGRAGGREKLVSDSRQAIEQLENEGFKIDSIEVGEPGEIVLIEDELFAVVPLTVVLDAQKTKMKQGSSIVGISADNGANWKFINGISQAKFKELFPKAAGKIRIPQDSLESVKDK